MPVRHALTFSSPHHRLFRYILRCLLAGLLIHQASQACSVPVFRYGLEHWKADPYRVLVFHQGALSPEAQSLTQKLKDDGARANVSVQVVDLALDSNSEAQALLKSVGSPALPCIVALPPSSAREPGVTWSGPLNAANITALLDSPTRKAIAERFVEGESAVWILLESGDKTADDAAASLLEARLAYLGTILELPKLDEQDIRNGLVSLPPDGLRLAFSLLRVSRTDPAEQPFIQMLLATEPDLKQTSGPIAFPIFGQGRALYALVDKGIKHETIDEAASFLIGSCSCQVKEKNPGADLLMAVDWKAVIRDQATGLEDLPPASAIVKGMPETVKIAPKTQAVVTVQPTALVNRVVPVNVTAIIGAVIGICLVVAAGLLLFNKRKR